MYVTGRSVPFTSQNKASVNDITETSAKFNFTKLDFGANAALLGGSYIYEIVYTEKDSSHYKTVKAFAQTDADNNLPVELSGLRPGVEYEVRVDLFRICNKTRDLLSIDLALRQVSFETICAGVCRRVFLLYIFYL